jgi:hypothetical protein
MTLSKERRKSSNILSMLLAMDDWVALLMAPPVGL